MRRILFPLLILFVSTVTFSQTTNIEVDISANRIPISPYLYGKNNSLSDNPGNPLSSAQWQKLRDAGIKLFRENGGNNATKYNWRLKLSSHPDWYNNVYAHDWDYEAQSLQQNIPGTCAMYAFQLLGKAAKSADYNFNDWAYNQSQWTTDVNNNWAGGGGPVSAGGNGGDGDIDLYLMDWPADSTVAVLDKWFGTEPESLDLDQEMFKYWNMDNEPEIWSSTHDDVMPLQCSAEDFMQRYFEIAIKARAKFPDIKLVGFVPCSEWYWFAWDRPDGSSGSISYKDENYTWIEFFIKRIAEKQDSTGIRLLDVLDLHTYLSASSVSQLMQVHRVFFDETYDYPGANGVKLLGESGWDPSITKEFIFKRINDWLDEYLGSGHGVTLGSTESGFTNFNQMPQALNYASTLGEFAKYSVELFTPWHWSPSYWEVIHLFSRYNKQYSCHSVSDDENYISAYPSVNDDNDSLTVVLVNRYDTDQYVQVDISNILINDGPYPAYTLSGLPEDNSTETFISHTDNALQQSNVVSAGNTLYMTLPAYSITSVLLNSGAPDTDYLVASPSNITINSEGSTDSIKVLSNVSWTAVSNQNWLVLNSSSGTNNDTVSFTVEPNTTYETRIAFVIFSATDVSNDTVTVTQAAAQLIATEELIIYTDGESLIEATWDGNGTLSEISTGAFEGVKHYSFEYSFSNWWAGYGLNLTNWSGDGSGYDFTPYESFKLACRLTGPASVSINLIDADGSTATDYVVIDGISDEYLEFTIPLASFTGMAVNDIGEIMININGNSSSGSGIFDIDNIRLGIFEDEIPQNLSVTDTIINNEETGCFDAYDTIMVAGNETTVEFTNGSFVTLIAEQSIIFLPGFHAFAGSYMNAYITTDGSFCSSSPDNETLLNLPGEKSISTNFNSSKNLLSEELPAFIYPNPNNGTFTLEIGKNEMETIISVFNISGEKVYQAETRNTKSMVYLPGCKKGIYFVRIISGTKQYTKKFIVE